jgi:phenylacetic acid degradation operon negative regulatory protein
MKAKTEEFLYRLMCAAETFARPTFRNMTESFDGWAYRKGLLRQLQRLERQQLLEGEFDSERNRVYRLTDAGRLHALGGRDPLERWRRRWDGRWRLILYDIPEAQHRVRQKLRRYLREHGFGYLQRSGWITPDPVEQEISLLADGPVDVKSLLILDARPCAGESDDQIVAGAWDFEAINKRYAVYQEILDKRPRGGVNSETAAKAFHRWFQEEQSAWTDAVANDPLLPKVLLPKNYAGQKACGARLKAMRHAGAQMRAAKLVPKPRDNP